MKITKTASIIAILLFSCNKESSVKTESTSSPSAGTKDHKSSSGRKASVGSRSGAGNRLEKISAEFRSSSDAEKAWEELASLDLDGTALIEARHEILQLILDRKGIRYSLNFLFKKHGAGAIRDDLISTAFAYSRESRSELLSLLNSLEDRRDRQSAKNGLLWEDVRPEDFQHLHDLTEETSDLLLVKMAHDAACISDKSQQDFENLIKSRMSEISQMIESGRINKSSLNTFLKYCAESSPFEMWRIVSSRDLDPNTFSDGVASSISSAMIGSDPAKAAKEFALNPLTDISLSSKAFLAWRKLDATAVDQWFAANEGSLDAKVVDSFKRAIALEALGGQDPDFSKAREAAGSITDSQTKLRVEGELWTRERERVIKMSQEDPAGTIEMILDGRSKHAPYWIETAMNEWVAKDRNAAWAWYEANRESLTPEQNEAVALSYARQALQSGQTDLAADWSRLVVTPKFQSKIRAEIKAAAKDGQ